MKSRSNNKIPEFFSGIPSREESYKLTVRYSPKLQSWSFSKYGRLGIYVFKFDFIANNFKLSCNLPLSIPLPEINLSPSLDNNPKILRYKTLLKVLQHPLATIVLAIASVAGIIFGAAALTPLHVAILVMSSLGIVGVILSYVVLPILRKKLIARFDYIEQQVKQKEYKDYKKLERISFIYKIILHTYFPGNNDLKWRYYYLNAISRHRCGGGFDIIWNPYVAALDHCETVEQKFLCLRGLINSAALWSSRVKFDKYDDMVEPYVAQISSASKLHQEFGAKLRSQVHDCMDTLLEDNHLGAIQKFEKIEFDAYAKKAYPDIAVIYHQLDAILTMIGRKHVLTIEECNNDSIRLGLVERSLIFVNLQYIFKFYTDKIPLYSNFLIGLNDFIDELPTPSKPKPGKPITIQQNKNLTIVEIEPEHKVTQVVNSSTTFSKLKV